MSKRIYIDTNVYLDYLEDRVDNIRPLGEFAFNVFKRTLECEFEIVCSDWVLQELDKNYGTSSLLSDLLASLKNFNNIITVVKSKSDEIKARNSSKNWKDYLHGLLALKGGAELIVTRNKFDFDEFSDLLEAKLPENI